MLLGLTDDSVTAQHRTALLCYEKWQRQVVKDQDPMFVGDFLGTAMDILSRSWQLQQAINQIQKDEHKAQFSVMPKKIKVGQNKLIILLVDPLETKDNVHIKIDKNGEKIEVSSFKKRNPYTLQLSMPESCLQVSMLVTIIIEKNGKSLGHRQVKCESSMRELDQLLRSSDNPLHFICQTLGLSPGDREQLDIFLAAAFQQNLPPHFNLLRPTGLKFHASCEEYPTLLHFSARYGLEKLSWQLLECPGGEQASQLRNSCQLTPADMAEHAGHNKLANTLRTHLQMTELSSMYTYLKRMTENQANDLVLNFNGTNYLLPRPLNNTYSVPPTARPVTSTPPPNTSTPTSPYPPQALFHQYTNVSSYQVPPSPVSVANSFDYNIPSFPLPVHSPLENYQVPGQAIPYNPSTPSTPSSPLDTLSSCGYMDMQPPINNIYGQGSANKLRQTMNLNFPHKDYHNCPASVHKGLFHSEESIINSQTSERRQRINSHSSNSAKSSITSAQDELAEIITDFKNNVFTISEVEKLVESWQNRHDVQQSFKEKQKQLNEMREEYEKIQKTMTENMKRATPFERIRKFFFRGRTKNCNGQCKTQRLCSASSTNPTLPANHRPTSSLSLQSSCNCNGQCKTQRLCSASSTNPTLPANHRPTSSLSLQSSCSSTSSGHMSTGSGTSLCDSGTQSGSEKLSEVQRLHEIPIVLSENNCQKDLKEQSEDLENAKNSKRSENSSIVLNRNSLWIQEDKNEREMEMGNVQEETDESFKGKIHDEAVPNLTANSQKGDNDIRSAAAFKTLSEMLKSNVTTETLDLPQINKLPLHPPDISNESSALSIGKELKTDLQPPNQLLIIEEVDKVESLQIKENLSEVIQSSEAPIEGLELENLTNKELRSSKGYVKSVVNFIENEKNFDLFEENEEDCENILEEAETEVMFEIPDYINVSSQSVSL